MQGLLSCKQCCGKTVHPGQLLFQRFGARPVFGGQMLGGANRSHRCFQSRGDGQSQGNP